MLRLEMLKYAHDFFAFKHVPVISGVLRYQFDTAT